MRNNPAFKRLLDAADAGKWAASSAASMSKAAIMQIMFPPDGKPPKGDGTQAESARCCLLGLLAEREREAIAAEITGKLEGLGYKVMGVDAIGENGYTVTVEVPE